MGAWVMALLLSGCLEVPKQMLLIDGVAQQTANCVRPSVSQDALPASFSVLSWNIYKQQGAWQAELDQWLDDSDLLLLQEAKAEPELHAWLHKQDYHWFQVAAFSWRDQANGVLTAAKAQATEACGKRLLEPATRMPKSLLFSYYSLQSSPQQLLLVNLHAINFSLRGRTYNEQLAMISQVINDYAGPVIVAGDFNRWNERRAEFLTRWATKEQLTEAVPSNDTRIRFLGYPLDAIYYRNLTLEQAEVLASSASDHHALKMRFSVNSKR